MAIGLVLYAAYGYRHSHLRRPGHLRQSAQTQMTQI